MKSSHLMWKVVAGWVLTVLCVGVQPGQGQIPDEFTNLEILPADIGKRDLITMMRGFAGALGVRCKHCHVGEDPNNLNGYDFASDKKPTKTTARLMMKMTQAINEQFISQVGRKNPRPVTCVTCHHGLSRPESLVSLLLRSVEKEGAEAAAERYKALRTEHFGSGAYDFRAPTLNEVAETLVREQNDLHGAILLMKLNASIHPDDSYVHTLLGSFLAQKGESSDARQAFEKALEIDAENSMARKGLDSLEQSSPD